MTVIFPRAIKSSPERLQIEWSDGHVSTYHPRDVRLACRCAACVEEWSHRPLLTPEQVPMNVRPARIQALGNYALEIHWTDGHSSGIYAYDHLREICGCDVCRKPREFDV